MPSLSPLGAFFSAKNLAEMSWYGRTEVATETAGWLQGAGRLPTSGFSYRDLFDTSFTQMVAEHRSAYVFKNALLRKLVFGRHSPNTTSFYFEFAVEAARADAVLVNGHATAYEIKTALDDFSRAASQANEYGKCFRYVTFVVDPEMVGRAESLLPRHVGIYALSEAVTLQKARPAIANPDGLDSRAIFKCLRRQEYEAALAVRGVTTEGVPPIEQYEFLGDRFSEIAPVEAQRILEHALRGRQPAAPSAKVCATLPRCLHAAVFGYRLRARDWTTLASRLDEPF